MSHRTRLTARSTQAAAKTEQPSAPIVVRTRFFDEALLRAQSDGAVQVVILAAGMDARALIKT